MDLKLTMDQLKLTEESKTQVGVALRMVSESRDRMNSYSEDYLELLEQDARAAIKGGSNQGTPVGCT
jgi:hypothetical protein